MAAALDGVENVNVDDEHIQKNVKETKVRKRKKDIFRRIRNQMEFYFSDSNLQKDEFLRNLIQQSEGGYVDLSEFMNFNKVKELTSSTLEIAKAMRSSHTCQVSDDELKIRRITQFFPLPNVEERTIYVENIPSNADHDWFNDVFKSFGKVVYVNLPKYSNPGGSGQLKGYAFIEFADVGSADNAVKYYSIPSPSDLYDVSVNKEAERKKETDTIEIQDKTTVIQKIMLMGSLEENNVVEFAETIGKRGIKREKTSDDEANSQLETVEICSKKSTKREKAAAGEVNNEPEIAKISGKQGIKREKMADESQEETPAKKSKIDNDEIKTSTDAATPENAAKKHRKRKKKHKEKYEAETLHLRVMSKLVWNRFRDKYLALQKEHMAMVKRSLKLWRHQEQKSPVPAKKCPPAPDPEYAPAVIIRVNLSQAVEGSSMKEVKTRLKEIPNVKYIDIKESRPCVYIRCTDTHSTIDVLSIARKEGEAVILEGVDEEEYWKQIVIDRANKLNSLTRKKVRGSEKIMAKVDDILSAGKGNCHIRFDE